MNKHLKCSGWVEIVRLLIKNGALPNVTTPDGETPVGLARRKGK